MRVTILGSGTAVPDADRFPAGIVVEADGEVILVDAGPGVLRRLAAVRPVAATSVKERLGPEHVTAVLLTHFHTDHCADVAALLFALRNPSYANRPWPLRLYAAAGLERWLDDLTRAWPWLEPREPGRIERIEVEPRARFAVGSVQVDPIPVEHTAQSLAYRLTAGGRSVAISGDADVCPELAEVARDADLFVCEAAFPAAHRTPGHLTPRLAAEAATQAGARALCLTHFYPECQGHDLFAEARAAWDGPLHLARDLLAFDLGST